MIRTTIFYRYGNLFTTLWWKQGR